LLQTIKNTPKYKNQIVPLSSNPCKNHRKRSMEVLGKAAEKVPDIKLQGEGCHKNY
jgi:hypothetical protein